MTLKSEYTYKIVFIYTAALGECPLTDTSCCRERNSEDFIPLSLQTAHVALRFTSCPLRVLRVWPHNEWESHCAIYKAAESVNTPCVNVTAAD